MQQQSEEIGGNPDADIIGPIARLIERQGMTVPAVMLLESCRPLHRLVDHVCALFPNPIEHPFVRMIRDREVCEALIRRLEASSCARAEDSQRGAS